MNCRQGVSVTLGFAAALLLAGCMPAGLVQRSVANDDEAAHIRTTESGETANFWDQLKINLDAFTQQPHLRAIGMTSTVMREFYERALNSDEITIGIVDGGFSPDHKNMRDRVSNQSTGPNGQAVDFDAERSLTNDSFHGTHVACLAAGGGESTAIGVAPKAEILMINMTGVAGQNAHVVETIEAGIKAAAARGAEVINLSMGCANTLALTEGPNQCRVALSAARELQFRNTLKEITAQGVVIIFAAGNSGKLIDGSSFMPFPTFVAKDIEGVISVTALDVATNDLAERNGTSMANYSETYVELAAPGYEDVSASRGLYSCWSGTADYTRKGGTSMAAPVVTGAASLALRYLKQSEKSIPQEQLAAEVERLLTEGGRTNEALRGKVKGAKQLDLGLLLQGLKSL